jgi:hypothetical protein
LRLTQRAFGRSAGRQDDQRLEREIVRRAPGVALRT